MHLIYEDKLKLAHRTFDHEQLVLEGCQGLIESCNFKNGRTTLIGRGPGTKRKSIYTQIDGGAVLVTGRVNLTFRDCTFQHNSSVMCGGAVSLQAEPGSTLTFESCIFEDNRANDTGPAIDILTSDTKVLIDNCTFRRNRSSGRFTSCAIGQVSIFPGSEVAVSNCRFDGNEIDIDYRGVVQLGVDKSYHVKDVTEERNTRLLHKVIPNLVAYLSHPRHYPWI